METAKLKRPDELTVKVADLANELMNAAVSFHKLHLKVSGVGSYAGHKALNELYDALPGHADDLVEGFQGATGKLLDIPDSTPTKLTSIDEGMAYMVFIKDKICYVQAMMSYSEISNDLDTAKSTINSVMYKIKFLK